MSLDKAIAHGKEHRKQYRGSKLYDCTCRNHGTCPACRRDRLHKFRDKKPMLEEDLMRKSIGHYDALMEEFANDPAMAVEYVKELIVQANALEEQRNFLAQKLVQILPGSEATKEDWINLAVKETSSVTQ